MCNPNVTGPNALNDIVILLQRVALDTSSMSSAMNRGPPINADGSESNRMLQKILDAIEGNSKKIDALTDRLDALEKSTRNMDGLKNQIDNLEKSIKEISASGSESNRKIDVVADNFHLLRTHLEELNENFHDVHKRVYYTSEETKEEVEKFQEYRENIEWTINENRKKFSRLIEKLDADARVDQENHLKQMEDLLNPIRNKLHETEQQLEDIRQKQEEQQKMSSNVLQEPNEIRKEQDSTLKLHSYSPSVSAEEDEEENVDLAVQVRKINTNGDYSQLNCKKITVKAKLTDSVKSITAQLNKEKGLENGYLSDRQRTDIYWNKTIGEQGIHLWEEGRLIYMYYTGI